MTDRDLGALLQRASEHLPEVDLAESAWAGALASRRRRRRTVVGGVAALAVAALSLTAVQLAQPPRPTPASSTTTSTQRTLADGTAYAILPPEGSEASLPRQDVGLPSVLSLGAPTTRLASLTAPPESVVAVYLRSVGEVFHPVLVTSDGTQVVADRLSLVRTNDANGNSAAPLGPRAIGAGGRYVVFPQRDHVVRLDTHSGATVSFPVPSKNVEWAGWNADGSLVVARSTDRAWTIDPWKPGAIAVAVPGGYEGAFRLGATADTGSLWIGRFGPGARLTGQRSTPTPVTDLWGETVNTHTWAASGAFFDQAMTGGVVGQDAGPTYQGLVAVEGERGRARLLLAPESPDGRAGRFKGCCTVLGWASATTVLFESVGSHGRWILGWDVGTGQVSQVMRVESAAPDDPTTIALNVGWRY